jgi:hypothetical protein
MLVQSSRCTRGPPNNKIAHRHHHRGPAAAVPALQRGIPSEEANHQGGIINNNGMEAAADELK